MSIKLEAEADTITDSEIYKFPGRSKSSVWNYFGFQKGYDGQLDKSKAVCKICRHGIRYSGNTTNLHCHLTKHKRNGVDISETMNGAWMGIDYKFVDSIVQSTMEDIKPDISIQSTSSDNDKSNQRSKHQQLNDTIVNFFIEHLLPLSVVESTSFYSMIAAADPMFTVPDKEYLYDHLILPSYMETKQSIEKEISESEVITSVEIWQSIDREKNVSISCQLINAQWTMRSFLLKTTQLCNLQNKAQFLSFLQATNQEWGIKRTVALVNNCSTLTEQASMSICSLNMPFCKKVLDDAGVALVTDPALKSLVEYTIFIIGNILQNSQSECYLKIYEMVKDYSEITIKTIRWTTFSSAISCILENKAKIIDGVKVENATVASKERWNEMKGVAEITNALLKAYNLLTEPQTVVSSMILPVLKKLETVLEKKTDGSESKLIASLKQSTWVKVSDRFRNVDIRNFLLLSSLLDPRYKGLKFVDKAGTAQARHLLEVVATDLYREGNFEKVKSSDDDDIIVVEESGDIIRIEPMRKRSRLDSEQTTTEDDWLADVISNDGKSKQTVSDKDEKVMIEIDHYYSTPQAQTPPLQWWVGREKLYPVLSRLARRYLCMSNSLISDNQSMRSAKLAPEPFDKLLVLHHNYFVGER